MVKTKKIALTKKSVAKKSVATKKTVKKIVSKNSSKAAAKKATVSVKPAKKSPSGMPEVLRDEALKVLDDRQGEDIVTIDLTDKSSVADYVIVASGRSARQISAMAHYVREAFIKHGIKNIRVEGVREGNWALIDGGDVIIHLFRPEVRSYYDLESIWDKKTIPKSRAG